MADRDILVVEQTTEPSEDRHERNLVRAFAVCVVMAFGLLIGQFYVGVFRQQSLKLLPVIVEDDPNAELKAKDTDQDGISDYDEQNVYFTSAYLSDSDSDGLDDRTELLSGSDANCPQGRTCRLVEPLAELKPEDLGVFQPINQPKIEAGALESITKLGSTELRKLLQTNGVPNSLLESMSDEELQKIYQATLEQMGLQAVPVIPSAATNAVIPSADTNAVIPSAATNAVIPSEGEARVEESRTRSPDAARGDTLPTNLTAAEVRELLTKYGLAPELLRSISDENLLQVYKDVLKQLPPVQP